MLRDLSHKEGTAYIGRGRWQVPENWDQGLFRWMESFTHCTPWRICGMSWPTMMEHKQLEQLVAEVRVHEKEGGVAGEVCSKMWRRDYEVQKIETKWLLSN